ncbi:MAG: peptidylprolyl isomerase [Microcoleus sp. CAN_BIN18]|nr:peptidylprolyl isomerase [Microcoleus sp. CAN_BIN18]
MTGLFQIGDKLLQAQDMPSLLKRYQLMPQFLRGVIVDQAIASFSCSDEERHSAVENFLAQHQLTAPEAKEAWLRSQNMTAEELQEMAVRPLLIEKFKQETWRPKVDNYFLTRKASLDHVVYSLVRTKNPALANELYFRILEAEQSFAEVARDFSEGPESKSGGLLGPVPLSQPHPAISKLLSVSQPNQLWTPRPLAEWMVIIRLEKFIPAQLDESMRLHLINELFESWLAEQISQIGPLQPLSSVSSIS